MYRNLSDETLVMLTLAGEQQAYEALVLRYQKTVISVAQALTHSQYMAEDAAQDAFVTAWMKLDHLREKNKFGPWVCRIAQNIAKNMIVRFRSYLSLDVLENVVAEDGRDGDPALAYIAAEETALLHDSVSNLPERVGTVIRLHYFEGLSVAEIADRLSLSVGTIKWQLHDGRKRMRKELCALNEQYSDTWVQRVMKKIEEMKLWQVKNSKNGFASVYKDVLKDVEELPESEKKYHALADVLMRGWWWLPGEKNDALYARIREAAERGHNDEVMMFIAGKESASLYGSAKIEYIRDKQIPRLEQAGFVKALASAWFWLGYWYMQDNQREKGLEAYKKVLALLEPDVLEYAWAEVSIEMEKAFDEGGYADKSREAYRLGAAAEELRFLDGAPRRWESGWNSKGYLNSIDRMADHLLNNASLCDGTFTVARLPLRETYHGSDGTTLTFAADNVTVKTPCGEFVGCQLWVTKHQNETYKSYYKEGVGLVKQEHLGEALHEERLLAAYEIVGGEGLLPLAKGNTWRYTSPYDPAYLLQDTLITVSYGDSEKALVQSRCSLERLAYNENDWLDMIQQIRNEYFVDGKVCDVSHAIERAEALAKTPMEKAHTKAAASVARRIMETDSTFNPAYTATGHWNFFARKVAWKENDTIRCTQNYRWSFELKSIGGAGGANTPLLYNDVYGILQDATGCLWSDEWRAGIERTVEYMLWGDKPIKTEIACTEAGTLTTRAGTFENCLKITLDIRGLDGGWSYRGGKKVYYFAPTVGIVRTENEYGEGTRTAVYELAAYEGRAEGYMPLADGLVRRYEAQALTDGYVGWSEYAYVEEENGRVAIFVDRGGIRKKPEVITDYGAIQGEILEDNLWDAGKHDEARLCHDVNNFKLLLHFFGRSSRYWGAPRKAVAWHKYRMQIMESLGDGEVPRAWLGHYAVTAFRCGCALFGYDEKEEGYYWLERAFALFPKWEEIADGEALEVGREAIYGGVKVIKGKGVFVTPDGTKELLPYEHLFDDEASIMLHGMTAPRGWEWFDGVRGEERFKTYIERAKAMTEEKK